MNKILVLAPAAAFAVIAAPALAQQIVFPPPGSHSFVQLSEASAPLHVCPNIQCQIVSDPSVNSAMAPVTFTDGGNSTITGFGSTSAGAMHAFVSATVFGEIDTAFDDTYTVHGGTGPFSITVTMNADAIVGTVPLGRTNIGLNNLVGIIGTFDLDPATTGFPVVNPFAGSQASASHDFTGGVAGTAPIDLSVSYTRVVNPGDVFDIGYELEAIAFGFVDASNTATISFALPDGVFLTAASGATFGDVPLQPGGGVPEPASWALMIAGFGLAGAALRRRRALPA